MAACSAPPNEARQAAITAVEPQRIVTLNGTLTEIVSALGLGNNIVGTDVTSKYPRGRECPAQTGPR
jgi:ABC-type hemin transport system substrate-binding protein